MADIDELNARVTSAILRAERMQPGSLRALAAYREVCSLEQAIARITSPGDVEGEASRIGAVTAALSAGEELLALQLADAYRQDDLHKDVLARLEELELKAQRAVSRGSALPPTVVPVRFRLRAA